MEKLTVLQECLFKSQALKIAKADSPFWYTSGMIGPFFINTHFLYGGEENAVNLLNYINDNLTDKLALAKSLYTKIMDFYNSNELFKTSIDELVSIVKANNFLDNIDFISGGERRDWFFSIPLAVLTNKPLLFIFKDNSIYDLNGQITNLSNKKICHVADLITVASSYERAWIPAIEALGAKLVSTVSVVDRNQGGKDILAKYGITTLSAIVINDDFFTKAVASNIITTEQKDAIIDFLKDSKKFGIDFLTKNPQFLKDSMNSSNSSTKDKSNRCVNDNVYGIKFF